MKRDLKKKEAIKYVHMHEPVSIPGKTTIESTWNKNKYPNMEMTWLTSHGVISAELDGVIAIVPVNNCSIFTLEPETNA